MTRDLLDLLRSAILKLSLQAKWIFAEMMCPAIILELLIRPHTIRYHGISSSDNCSLSFYLFWGGGRALSLNLFKISVLHFLYSFHNSWCIGISQMWLKQTAGLKIPQLFLASLVCLFHQNTYFLQLFPWKNKYFLRTFVWDPMSWDNWLWNKSIYL